MKFNSKKCDAIEYFHTFIIFINIKPFKGRIEFEAIMIYISTYL